MSILSTYLIFLRCPLCNLWIVMYYVIISCIFSRWKRKVKGCWRPRWPGQGTRPVNPLHLHRSSSRPSIINYRYQLLITLIEINIIINFFQSSGFGSWWQDIRNLLRSRQGILPVWWLHSRRVLPIQMEHGAFRSTVWGNPGYLSPTDGTTDSNYRRWYGKN